MIRRTSPGIGAVDFRRLQFETFSPAEKQQAVLRMASKGYSDATIAAAISLSIEMVRRVISRRPLPHGDSPR